MADQQLYPPAEIMLYDKHDIDRNVAEFIVTVRNLKKGRDKVEVTLPADRQSPLVIRVNDKEVKKVLPGAIDTKKSNHKYECGKKGWVKVELHKVIPEIWDESSWSSAGDSPDARPSDIPLH